MSRMQPVTMPSSQRTLGSILLLLRRTSSTSTWVPAFAGTTVKSWVLATELASASSAAFGHQEVLP